LRRRPSNRSGHALAPIMRQETERMSECSYMVTGWAKTVK
jgi:hypothetical protein